MYFNLRLTYCLTQLKIGKVQQVFLYRPALRKGLIYKTVRQIGGAVQEIRCTGLLENELK